MPFLSHKSLNIFPISAFNFPYISALLNFGAKTIWYLQFQLVCDKLSLFIKTSCDFCGRQICSYSITGGFILEAKAFPLPLHSRGFICLYTKKDTCFFQADVSAIIFNYFLCRRQTPSASSLALRAAASSAINFRLWWSTLPRFISWASAYLRTDLPSIYRSLKYTL